MRRRRPTSAADMARQYRGPARRRRDLDLHGGPYGHPGRDRQQRRRRRASWRTPPRRRQRTRPIRTPTTRACRWGAAPSLNIVKTASVPGRSADVAGETISYTHHGGEYRQPRAHRRDGDRSVRGCAARPTHGLDVVGDEDALLEVGETWSYTAVHTVTQARDRQQRRRRRASSRTPPRPTATRPTRTPTTPACRWQQPRAQHHQGREVPGGTADAAGE